MKVSKRLATLGLAVGLAVAGCMTAFAEEFTVHFEGVFSSQLEDTGNTMSSEYENPFSGPLYNLYDENATITMDSAKTYGMSGNPSVYWGYLENGRFVMVDSFEKEDYNGIPMFKGIESQKAYPVLNPGQLAKDKADGSAYSKTYVLLIDGVESVSHSNVCLGYFFNLKQAGAAAGTALWKQDAVGWWWDNGDGTYPVNQWMEINGKYYYFGADGYMLHDTVTPDNYTVDGSGAWVPDGTDQTR